MQRIRALDPITITKIAAGEVIDRPASIIKELVENAIDAGATEIHVQLESGGKKRIQIRDNGSGISKEDLPLAPLRHTTSKITRLEDIYDIHSFGFRGEALASIAHVAQLEIHSRTADALGYRIKAFQDTVSELKPVTHPVGTTITVLDLFFDMPVRKKFLKSDGTEFAKCLDVLTEFALIQPHIGFKCSHNDIEVLNTFGITDQEQLIYSLLSKSLKSHVIPIDHTEGPLHVQGYISDPTVSFPNRAKQILAINHRLVKSPVVQSAAQKAYKDVIVPKRYPFLLLNLSVENQGLDVNVHPQKLDIKFLDPGLIFDLLPKCIQHALNTSQRFQPLMPTQDTSPSWPTSTPFLSEPSRFAAPSTPNPVHTTSSNTGSTYTTSYTPQPQSFAYTTPSASYVRQTVQQASQYFSPNAATPSETALEPPSFLQVFDTYIVLSTPEGLYILDQHAVHERILYEKFKRLAEQQEVPIQPLLVGEVLEVSPSQIAAFEIHQAYLKTLGFELDLFGPQQVVVRAIPTLFTQTSLEPLLHDLLEQLSAFPGSARDLTLDQKETLQMKACKAAIKAGKRLEQPEVAQLIQDFLAAPQNFTCPHGRPLCLHFSKSKLESLFLRT